jgi:glycosyltransferase involved in cell wall biosynthesis
MVTSAQISEVCVPDHLPGGEKLASGRIDVAMLTGGQDRHYAFGLAMSLLALHVNLEIIASDELDCREFRETKNLKFFNLRGDCRPNVGFRKKVERILRYYVRLLRYAFQAHPGIFHILWNNKFEFLDRTVLMLCYKALGKKIVLTAHNVNAGKRDLSDGVLNRLSLRFQYRLADHIFVHTEKMKEELVADFGVRQESVTVVPFGINNAVPITDLTRGEAKRRLSLGPEKKTILFFGAIAPYKGLHFLIEAFQQIAVKDPTCHLIIAGKPKGGCDRYLMENQEEIRRSPCQEHVLQHIGYVPDEEIEVYFKAADLLVLPYADIFQSGILLLGYSFGVPVVATDVGSFRDDIVEGRTGLLCEPRNAESLARAIEKYFASDLFHNLDKHREEIKEYASKKHAWETVGAMTREVYASLDGHQRVEQ